MIMSFLTPSRVFKRFGQEREQEEKKNKRKKRKRAPGKIRFLGVMLGGHRGARERSAKKSSLT
jgi:hypothetical protein